jgi:hypothetical protein
VTPTRRSPGSSPGPATNSLVIADGSGPPCDFWDGATGSYCRREAGVRRFLPGLRCPDHTPAALVGQPEAPERNGTPWWIRDGKPIPLPPLPTVFDVRAVTGGRRASGTRRRQAWLGESYDDAQGRR